MSSIHSVPIIGAPSGVSAVYADCFARHGSDAGPVGRDRRRTTPALPRRFRLTSQGQTHLEDDIRREERCRERARLVHELHDTLLQGFLGASMLLDQAVEQTPTDSPFRPALNRALRLVRRAIDEGRAALRELHTTSPAHLSLEQALSNLLHEVATGSGIRLRIFVRGKARTLRPAIQEQLCLIVREAVVNAWRHSSATSIEVEVQYLPDLLRVFVRDNGRGFHPETAQSECDSHWGICGMRERADSIGARFSLRSRRSAGTEVRIALPVSVAKQTHDPTPWERSVDI